MLIPIELEPEKLDPLDLLPLLLDPLDDGTDAEMLGPVPLPPVFEKPGPESDMCGPTPELDAAKVATPLDDPFASLCVHTPSAR